MVKKNSLKNFSLIIKHLLFLMLDLTKVHTVKTLPILTMNESSNWSIKYY